MRMRVGIGLPVTPKGTIGELLARDCLGRRELARCCGRSAPPATLGSRGWKVRARPRV